MPINGGFGWNLGRGERGNRTLRQLRGYGTNHYNLGGKPRTFLNQINSEEQSKLFHTTTSQLSEILMSSVWTPRGSDFSDKDKKKRVP